MALFFDRTWFDARLAALNLPRAALAAAAGLSEEDLALVFKDQREVSAEEVAAFALILGASQTEVAQRCGVSTRGEGSNTHRLDTLEQRIAVLEAKLEALSAIIRPPGR